ncbi:MAG: helix-hairpin-helix domain-containing protein [Candidatus Parcubacteria bacterium]|nr:helix-hairpin-helix domain-containing protein [Candidatus Parcubacteria bacterium]
MRTAGLLALAIFFPAFVWATALVNINTADKATLMSLTGLGGTGVKAQAVIDYRAQHGSFASIEDIQKVTGIGPSTYAGLKDFITVGDTSASDTTDTPIASTTDSSTQEQTSSSSSGSRTTSPPSPSALTLDAGNNQDAVMEVPLHLFARATVKGGAVDPSAQIVWGFGDASSAEGSAVEKTYRYAGSYLVVVTATDGQATGRDEFIVTVRPAQVRILEIPDTGIVVTNDTNERLDLSSWALFADKSSFRVPNGTVLLPKANVLFSSTITKLPTAPEVTLAYPGGGIAARYTAPVSPVEAVVQLSGPVTGFNEVQTVEPTIINPKTNIQVHAEAVSAPVATTELAAAGAALTYESPASTSRFSGIFKSPWALSFLGVVVLAGSAFIFL